MTLKQIRRFFRKHEPELARLFEEAIAKVRVRREFERAIKDGNIPLALTVLNLDESIFSEFQEAMLRAYNEAGRTEYNFLLFTVLALGVEAPPAFQILNPRVIQESTGLARQFGAISEDMESNVARLITEENQKGRTPRQIANMVRTTLGLSERQTKSFQKAMEELENNDKAYFQRNGRDKRFDKAVRDGDFNKEQVLAGYAKRMQKQRAVTIARTETNILINYARYEAVQQLVDAGLPPSAVQFIWKDQRDARVRDAHRAMNEQIRPFGTPFTSPTGGLLRFPGDTSLGAGPEDIVNCRCWMDINIGDT